MSDGGPPDGDLRTVRLLGLPLDVQQRAEEHFEELRREFTYITDPHAHAESVPRRLLALSESLQARFGSFTAGPRAEREAARERGDATVDLEFRVPATARDAVMELEALLDEADEFCRSGDLLTLATPPDLVAFRRWYLGEFVAQIDGASPTPFSQATAAR